MPSVSFVPTLLSGDVGSVHRFNDNDAMLAWVESWAKKEYHDKKHVPCWLAGPCKTPQPLDKGVASVSCLVLDVDVATSREALVRALAGLCCLAHTTYSSTPAEPRWRVILPLDTPMASGALKQVYKAFLYPLARSRGLEVDATCLNPARKWLVPCHSPSYGAPATVLRFTGTPLDTHELTSNPWAAAMRRVPPGARDNTLFDLVRDAKRARLAGDQLAELRSAAIDAGLEPEAVDSKLQRAAEGVIGGPAKQAVDGFQNDADPVAYVERVVGRAGLTRNVRTGELLLDGEPVTDRQVNEWARHAYQTVESRRLQPEPMAKLIRTHMRDYAVAVDPAREAVESFQWDGKPRIDRMFQTYWGCADNDVARAVGGLWLIGAAGKLLGDKRAVPFVPIIHGVENTGKSLVTKALASALGPGTLADSVVADKLESRDMAVALSRVVIVELAELTSLLRDSVRANEIKNFITSTFTVARRLYKDDETAEYHRSVVFLGTTNEERFVRSTDGNRRLPILVLSDEAGASDPAAREAHARARITSMQRDAPQLWAEALVRYRSMWPEGAELADAGTVVALSDIAAVNRQANRFLLTRPDFDILISEAVHFATALDDGRQVIPLRHLVKEAVERKLGGNAYIEIDKAALRSGYEKVRGERAGKTLVGYYKEVKGE